MKFTPPHDAESLMPYFDALFERGILKRDDTGNVRYTGSFIDLMTSLHLENAMHPESYLAHRRRIAYVNQDLSNLMVLAERLNWMKHHAKTSEEMDMRWFAYGSLDVEHWHIHFGSLLDHVALLISNYLADKPGQVPRSFSSLYERAERVQAGGNTAVAAFSAKLGSRLLCLIQSADWYPLVDHVRNLVVHNGGEGMVFDPKESEILFQIFQPADLQNQIIWPPLMYNPNVVYFKRYASYMLARLLLFLEELAEVAFERLGLSRHSNGWQSGETLNLVLSWIEETVKEVDPR